MIKEIKQKIKKYQEISKQGSEYVSIPEILNDLSYLLTEARIKRLPKNQR